MNQFPSALFNTKPVPASETKTIKMAKISISADVPKSPNHVKIGELWW